MNKTSEKQFAATGGNKSKRVPLHEQVRKEFKDAAEHGKAGREQLMNELSEPHES